jgi:hypothetical protein
MNAVRSRSPRGRKPAAKPFSLVETLASVRFAVLIVALIAVACAAGTLVPQGSEAARYLEAHPEAAQRFAVFEAVGLTAVYTSWWFIGLLFVLSASVLACSSKRFSALLRTSGFARRRCLGSLLTHMSILLILAGGIVRGVWGVKGYVELREGRPVTEFLTDKGARPLPAALRLNRFEVETDQPKDQEPASRLLVRWPEKNVEVDLAVLLNQPQSVPSGPDGSGEAFSIEVLKYEPDFLVDPETGTVGSRSTEPRNPAILVAVNGADYHNHTWLFSRFPGFATRVGGHDEGPSPLELIYQAGAAPTAQAGAPIKAFRSHVEFLPEGAPPVSGTVEVNGPFSFGGYTFYQSGYRPEQPDWTALQVVRDPGVPLVYAGFVLMIAGLFVVFYLNAWITPRRSAS